MGRDEKRNLLEWSTDLCFFDIATHFGRRVVTSCSELKQQNIPHMIKEVKVFVNYKTIRRSEVEWSSFESCSPTFSLT